MDSHAGFQTVQQYRQRPDRPITPLTIGQQAELKGVPFTIIGMIEYVSHQSGEGWAGMSAVHAVTRTVRDSAALLDATAGPDPGAPYAAQPPERPWLEEVGAPPRSLRIALQTETFNGQPTHPDCVAAAKGAAQLCESLGHVVEETSFQPGDALRPAAGLDARATAVRNPGSTSGPLWSTLPRRKTYVRS